MRRRRGFTFVELMVVMAIVVILITMAIPMYVQNLTRSREAVLKSNLFAIRIAINRYMFEQGKAPKTLDDLQTGGYLKGIPIDPITGDRNSWRTSPEESNAILDQDAPGIGNVHSGSPKTALDGTHYADW
ncbi:MAG: prepilin-type N-terminal cleavage/methylation domain-containing protein [Candidatus Sulfopaludibacter sp.]|nr:prepilin-type N-terminal cleavage/methylation domain-containing protein [Candidatus Sulfopaludibacter sp.]